jgi:choline-sulfatase
MSSASPTGSCTGSIGSVGPVRSPVAVVLAALLLLTLSAGAPWAEAGDRKPNVVLVVIDALRPDHLGCYGYPHATSPNIDALAGKAVVFENAIAQVPWTKSSFSSMFTSLYPFQHGVEDWESVLAESLVTLPELLREAGYTTAAVINILALEGRYQVLQGFDTVNSEPKNKRDAEATTDDAIDLIRASSEPFFVMIHYFDPHEPYAATRGYVEKVRPDADMAAVQARLSEHQAGRRPAEEHRDKDIVLYDACIRQVDDQMVRLLGLLDEMDIADQTLVIITADHGEAFWEHGCCCHAVNLYDEVLRVPLIISYPKRYRTPRRIEPQVSLIDLLPTIAGLTGISDAEHREGLDLDGLVIGSGLTGPVRRFLPGDMTMAEISLRTIPETKCLRTTRWKMILEPATGWVELYDLAADAGETVDVSGSEATVADSLLDLMRRVPGIPLQGWRMAFTGGKTIRFRVKASVEGQPQFTLARKLTRGRNLSGEPGVFIWWLPGDPAIPARPVSELTPGERQKLKALGYIQ